jgi:hypothetical protein
MKNKRSSVTESREWWILHSEELCYLYSSTSRIYPNQGEWPREKRNYSFNRTCCYATTPFSLLATNFSALTAWITTGLCRDVTLVLSNELGYRNFRGEGVERILHKKELHSSPSSIVVVKSIVTSDRTGSPGLGLFTLPVCISHSSFFCI